MKVIKKQIGKKEQYLVLLNSKEIEKLDQNESYIDKRNKWKILLTEEPDIKLDENKKLIEMGQIYFKALKTLGKVSETSFDIPKYVFEIEQKLKYKKKQKK